MNARQPFFSIVIPTRNRAHLLKYALQSALEQTFDDYEVVVSDNNSSDETEAVVRALADKRVRYVRTDRSLSMPDSWEFALGHADGRFISYLSDDDAIQPTLLERAASALTTSNVRVVTWYWAHYYYPDWPAKALANTLMVRSFSGRLLELDGQSVLKQFYEGRYWTDPLPKMLNCVCDRRIIEDTKARAGHFFWPWAPDYSSAIAILSQVGQYVHLDAPLLIAGSGRASAGAAASYYRGEALIAFLREFDGQPIRWYTPLRSPLVTNYVVDTALRVKCALSEPLADEHFTWAPYFVSCYGDLLTLREHDVDVSADLSEFESVLASQPPHVRSEVQSSIATLHRRQGRWLKIILRELVRRSPALARMEVAVRPQIKTARSLVIRGENAGFSNISECAQRLPRLLADGYDQCGYGSYENPRP